MNLMRTYWPEEQDLPTAAPLLTYRQVGARLNMSERSVRRLGQEGKLAVVYPRPGTPRIRPADLEEYIRGLEKSRARKVVG